MGAMTAAPNFQQELTAVFGQPVAENPTQAMVEAAYSHHGLDWRYLTIEVAPADLAAAVAGARVMGFRGFNCTIPHKVAVIEHLDGLGESAEVMGAVNCVVRDGQRLIGENTDGKGFVQSLCEVQDPAGTRLALFGAGGAARAISVEMALAGTEHIALYNRAAERGEQLAALLRERLDVSVELHPWDGMVRVPEGTDVVVQATSIGLFPDVDAIPAIDMDSLQEGMVVADVIPNPPRTRLVQEAEARGCRVLDGLGMLVNQGVIGVKHWSGVDPDPGVMRRALEEIFLPGGAS